MKTVRKVASYVIRGVAYAFHYVGVVSEYVSSVGHQAADKVYPKDE